MAAEGLTRVIDAVSAAALRSGRDPSAVTVVAVSKGRQHDAISALYDEGHRHFGENRADELAAKAAALPGDIVWHFIGSIQSRQVKTIVPHAVWIHSVDRLKIASGIARHQSDVQPRCLIQVNVAGESQKHGVDPGGAAALLAESVDAGLDVAGLMLIPPLPETPEDSRPLYRELVGLRDEIATADVPLATLSMGMTADYEVAVEEGATVVRVGRAIFDG